MSGSLFTAINDLLKKSWVGREIKVVPAKGSDRKTAEIAALRSPEDFVFDSKT